jgi:hypothetical protein
MAPGVPTQWLAATPATLRHPLIQHPATLHSHSPPVLWATRALCVAPAAAATG